MSSSFKYTSTNKYTLQKPINKEMYEQAEAQGLHIYDTAGRKAVGVDSATGKVKYEYENQPSNSSVTIPGTGTTGGKVGSDVGKITHDNLTGAGNSTKSAHTSAKTSVYKTQPPQKSPGKLPGTFDTPKITKFPLKVNDGVYKPETTWETTPKVSTLSEGQRAYSEIEAALSTKYSPKEFQQLLSKVTPEKLEKTLPIADSVIKKNIDSGRVNADYYEKHPFARSGLSGIYTDDGTFTKNDYKMLNDVKYMEGDSKTQAETSSYKIIQPYENLYKKSVGKILDTTWDQIKKSGSILKDSFSSIYNDIIDSLEPVLSKLEEAKTSEEKTKEPVYYSQLDERWAGQAYGEGLNIEKAGCGITSMAMILSTLTGEAVTPPEMAKYSTDIGTAEDGTDISFFKKTAEEYGLKATDSYWAYQYYDSKIKDDLNNGSMYVTNLFPKGSVWSDGHFIVVSDYVESDDGNYFVAYDPNFDNAITYYKNGVTVDETTEGKIYIPEDVLRKDARYMIGISK